MHKKITQRQFSSGIVFTMNFHEFCTACWQPPGGIFRMAFTVCLIRSWCRRRDTPAIASGWVKTASALSTSGCSVVDPRSRFPRTDECRPVSVESSLFFFKGLRIVETSETREWVQGKLVGFFHCNASGYPLNSGVDFLMNLSQVSEF